jgi:hypothetical protein
MTRNLIFVTDGRNAAILCGTLSFFDFYPSSALEGKRREFEKRGLKTPTQTLLTLWLDALRRSGLLSTREQKFWPDYDARASLTVTFELTSSDIEICAEAVSACADEFKDDWDEFLTVATGELYRYRANPEDLRSLAENLRASLPTPV